MLLLRVTLPKIFALRLVIDAEFIILKDALEVNPELELPGEIPVQLKFSKMNNSQFSFNAAHSVLSLSTSGK